MTTPTDYAKIAERLAAAARSQALAAAHVAPDEHSRSDFVTLRYPQDRYPFETVYIDADGYTWGDRFEHRLPLDDDIPEGRSHRVLTAILASREVS